MFAGPLPAGGWLRGPEGQAEGPRLGPDAPPFVLARFVCRVVEGGPRGWPRAAEGPGSHCWGLGLGSRGWCTAPPRLRGQDVTAVSPGESPAERSGSFWKGSQVPRSAGCERETAVAVRPDGVRAGGLAGRQGRLRGWAVGVRRGWLRPLQRPPSPPPTSPRMVSVRSAAAPRSPGGAGAGSAPSRLWAPALGPGSSCPHTSAWLWS